MMNDVSLMADLRALVVGLGREGVALATYLARHGLTVTATDAQPAEKLGALLPPLEAAGVSLALGGHPLSLLAETDVLFVSPGVPLEAPFIQEAMARKIPLSTESKLTCQLCPATVFGITGSSGKTTTTTLLGKLLAAAGRKTWVGGNLGYPLIQDLEQIQPQDAVVLELSSFQLEYFRPQLNKNVDPAAHPEAVAALIAGWSPPISAILNITPNHLDRHPTMKHYVQAKRGLIDYQGPEGVVVMNLDNDMTRTIGNQFGRRTRWFSLEAQMPGGACLGGRHILLLDADNTPHQLIERQAVKLRGDHNLSNIMAACLMAREAGVSLETMRAVVADFRGVEHRLEFVRELRQVRYFNDTIATSPERLLAALRSFEEPIVLLAGGYDKHLPWESAARLMIHKARHVLLFGPATDKIEAALAKAQTEVPAGETTVHRCESLQAAVTLAAQVAQAGDVVLLSPGCASFDAFRDFAERGVRFREWVLQL
jgi:UDP-N-acetylmuramoylalanine--D-glutamate ligase